MRTWTFLPTVIMGACLGLATTATAQDTGKKGTPIPYSDASPDNVEIQQIWQGWGGDYLKRNDPMRYVVLAHLKDSKDRSVLISQIGSLTVCGATTCPVRILIDGELINETMACDDQDQHVLVPSKGAVFLCDIAVPLETKADIAAAKSK